MIIASFLRRRRRGQSRVHPPCMRDCLERGEARIASHLRYAQPGILRDGVPEERRLGIEAGFAWATERT